MGYGSGCCCSYGYNLMKLDSSTGTIIWTSTIWAGGTFVNPAVNCLKALHGTTDIIALVGDTNALVTHLVRMDDTGTVIRWWRPILLSTGLADLPTRVASLGCDGTNIVAFTQTSGTATGMIGYDYSGNVLWNTAFVNTPLGMEVTTNGTVVAFNLSPFIATYNSSTGALTSSTTTNFGDNIPRAIDSGSGNFFIAAGNGAHPNRQILTNGTYAVAVNGPAPIASFKRGDWGPGGIMIAAQWASGSPGYVYDPATLNEIYHLSNAVGGFHGTTLGDMNACCSDSNPFYIWGTGLPRAGPQYHMFATDNAQNLQWTQLWAPTSIATAAVFDMCISDDGFLYAGGTFVPA